MIKNILLLSFLSISLIHPSADPAQSRARKHFVLMSAPGSGKGTFSQYLVQKYGYKHLSLGDIYRAEVAAGTELGKKIKPVMDRGDMVDETITCAIVDERLNKILTQKECFIVDNFPRSAFSLKFMADFINEHAIASNVCFVKFNASDDTCVRRIKGRRVCTTCGSVFNTESAKPKEAAACDGCGSTLKERLADTEEVTRRRLESFHKEVEPILAAAAQSFASHNVDTERDLAVLHAEYDALVAD